MIRVKILHAQPAILRIQYIPRNMHTVFALLCFVVVIHWLIFPYPSSLLHWHCGNLTIAPVPAKQPWWIWINTSCEFIMNDSITTTKQSTTKPCAYFLGYTVWQEAHACGPRQSNKQRMTVLFLCRRLLTPYSKLLMHACLFQRVPVDDMTALIQIMAWRRTDDDPLSEAMITYLIDAYMCCSAPMS